MKNDHLNIDPKLLVLYLLEEISGEGRLKVEAWLDASESNRNHFQDLRKTWEATGTVDPESVAFDTNRAWERLNRRIVADAAGGEADTVLKPARGLMKVKEWGMVRVALSVAAVVLFMMVSVVLVRYLQNRQDTLPVMMASLASPVQDTLTDGTRVVLNARSELSVPKKFAKDSRLVKLRGEAFFEVEPDSARPFIIDAGPGQVKVLGTSFHVKAYPGADLEVFVETGRVELSVAGAAGGDSVKMVLKAGERGMILSGTGSIVKPPEIGPDELFWANKKLIFQETKLSLVFDLLNKHYQAVIEVQDSTIRNCMLSATFTDEPIDRILEVIAASFDLTLSVENEKYFIKGKGCGNEE